jgi:UDP-3-O-[3-hydroxymyristoyl] glucosamine N-acyltransferase
MIIDQELVNKCFNQEGVNLNNKTFNSLNLINSEFKNTLSYLSDIKFIPHLLRNENISACFIKKEFLPQLANSNIFFIEVEDPTFYFFTLFNYLIRNTNTYMESIIDSSAKIHPTAVISSHGVFIDANVKIGANTVVDSGTIIKNNVEIGNNCTIGCEDVEIKHTSKGVIRVAHNAQLIVMNNVYIGSNCIITKGIYDKDTIIHENVSISGNSHISHSSTVGSNSMILGAHLCGSCTIGKNVKIYPNAVISNGIKIANNAEVSLGSVVITNVNENQKVSGNFAYDHLHMLRDYGKRIRKK